jgi:hypothetical protein
MLPGKKRGWCVLRATKRSLISKLETILNEKIPLVYPVVDPQYATPYP